MSPVLVLAAAWLLVIGYGLVYIGYKNLGGTKVTFSDAFGLPAFTRSAAQGATASSQNPIQNKAGSLVTAS